MDDQVAAEFAAAEMDAEEQGEQIVGRDIPEFQQVAPALREDIADENQVIVGDLAITRNSSVVTLREAAKFQLLAAKPKPLGASGMSTSNHSVLPQKLSTQNLVLRMHLLNPRSVSVSYMKSLMVFQEMVFIFRDG